MKLYFESYLVEVRANMCVLPNDFGIDDEFQKIIDRELDYTPHVDIKVSKYPDSIDEFNEKVDKFIEDISNNKINGLFLFMHLTSTDLEHETTSNDSCDVRRFIRAKGTGNKYAIYES
ncbi:MAG TPA: hypothetical protein DG753_12120 [Clostridium sp.]|nr:hypothetical protein [Clostridium sp.]